MHSGERERPLAAVTLSEKGLAAARRLGGELGAELFFPASLGASAREGETPYRGKTGDLLKKIYKKYRGFVMIMPLGAVVRLFAPLIESKYTDPAVVVVDVLCRYAIAALGGHEGGANDLALAVSNVLFAEAVITTTTEAEKDIIVGIGARRGVAAADVERAVRECLAELHIPLERVRLLATGEVKAREEGILRAARSLGVPLKIVAMRQIGDFTGDVESSRVVRKHLGVGGVCEPSALLAGRNGVLIQRKRNFTTLSLAVARESSPSQESAPETRGTGAAS